MPGLLNAEAQRLAAAHDRSADWQRWGPYLSERQWGTVREDYSERGDTWGFFTHDHARSRAYRWGEAGCWESAIGKGGFVLDSRCGTGKTRF